MRERVRLDVGAFFGHRDRVSTTLPATGSRDDCDLTFEPSCHRFSVR